MLFSTFRLCCLASCFALTGIASATPSLVSSNIQRVSLHDSNDFAPGSFVVEPNVQTVLAAFVPMVQSKPGAAVVVRGFAHTADLQAQQMLALARAKSIRAALVLHGLSPDNVAAQVGRTDEGRPGEVQFDIVPAAAR